MALLLKSKRNGTNSIRQMLSRHMNKILLFLILIAFFGVGFYLETSYRFIQSNDRLIQNNEFFLQLSETKNYLYERLFYLREEDIDMLEKISCYLEKFRKEKISTVYERDMEDLCILFKKYTSEVEQLEERVRREAPFVDSMYFYENACNYLEMMERYHQPVQYEIINYEEKLAEIQRKSVFFYTLMFIVTLLLICSMIVVETRQVKQSIIVPLQVLMDSIDGVDFLNPEGNAGVKKSSFYNDEVNETIEKYNAMLDKLRQQSMEHNELMNTKLQLKEQKYQNLQHQINPHFLFNTLNMIAQTAYLEGDEQTVPLIETTAHLLRYSLDYVGREVTLRQELEALEHYVSLQEQRFVGKIRFRFVLDETLNSVKIPSLILQPLVENAITHGGVMYVEIGEITVETSKEADGKNIRISVIDNGIGMDKEHLERVDAAMRRGERESGCIGLMNVFSRLSIFYHQRSDIRLISDPGVRTEVVLLLPEEQE